MRLRLLFLQVSPECSRSVCWGRRKFSSVPWLTAIRDSLLVLFITYSIFPCFARLLLILSGDVELNPGPFYPQDVKKVQTRLEILLKICKHQAVLLDTLAAFKQKQASVDEILETFCDTLQTVESELEALRTLQDEVQHLRTSSQALASRIEKLGTRHDDLKNRPRKYNFMVYGLRHEASETWSKSEQKFLVSRNTKLDMQILWFAIECAHKIGQQKARKTKPNNC